QRLLAAGARSPEGPPAVEVTEADLLRLENEELRKKVEGLEKQLAARSPAEGAEVWAERQKEYENLLEEKSEVIRALHVSLQDGHPREGPARAAGHGPGPGAPPQELQPLKKELDDRRRQLEEDEESLMEQMRQLEMTMCRDRAELARQRAELQRLSNDLRHEIEQAARDAGLRERLIPLQRRHQDLTTRKGS